MAAAGSKEESFLIAPDARESVGRLTSNKDISTPFGPVCAHESILRRPRNPALAPFVHLTLRPERSPFAKFIRSRPNVPTEHTRRTSDNKSRHHPCACKLHVHTCHCRQQSFIARTKESSETATMLRSIAYP